jgi:hypothetical protein
MLKLLTVTLERYLPTEYGQARFDHLLPAAGYATTRNTVIFKFADCGHCLSESPLITGRTTRNYMSRLARAAVNAVPGADYGPARFDHLRYDSR